MKFKLTLVIIIAFAMHSCTIQKRTHRSGYYVDWHKKSTNSISEHAIIKTNSAATTDKISPSKRDNMNFFTKALIDCEDTLLLLTGEKIICNILEVDDGIIQYEDCKGSESIKQTIPSSKIRKIYYANGGYENINEVVVKPFFNHKREFVQAKNKDGNCLDTIFIGNGKTVACKIVEISKNEVKYKKCTDASGSLYTIERCKLNGNVNAIANESAKKTKPESIKKNQESFIVKKTNHPLSIISFILAMLALFGLLLIAITFEINFLVSALFLLGLSFVFGVSAIAIILSNKDRYKGIGYASFGVILFLLILALAILVILSFG